MPAAGRCLILTVVTLLAIPCPSMVQAQDEPAEATASFTEDVAPLLVSRCGACHIDQARGGLSMKTYPLLLKGSRSGRVIQRGRSAASRLVELITKGDMPKEGEPLGEEEVARIARWIDAGAKFDGRNPRSPLAAIVRNSSSIPEAGRPAIPTPPGDAVPFSSQVAPLLVEHCTGCHGADRPRGGLSMASFERLSAGGDSGPVFTAAQPAESLIVAKLKGTADGARMPLDRPPLPAEDIQKIEQWIAAGALYDAADPTQALQVLVEIVLAGSLTHEDLSTRRDELARADWRLALPDTQAVTTQTAELRLWGNVDEAALARIVELASTEGERVARLLKTTRAGPFIKGKLTLFVFNHRYEYSEFGQMVEGRQLPPGQTGHWRNNTLNAYACLTYSPGEEDATLPALLSRQLAGAYLANFAGVPTWFAEGCARSIAARCHPDDSQVQAWPGAVASSVSALARPEDFLAAESLDGAYGVIAFGFAEHLMSDSRRFHRLLRDLRDGDDFPASFTRAYGARPDVVFAAWAASAGRR